MAYFRVTLPENSRMAYTITSEPFGVLPDQHDPILEYTIADTETGEYMTIVPGYGGIVRRLALRKNEKLIPILYAPISLEGMIADESYASALMFPYPSRIKHGTYRFEGEAYALRLNELNRDNSIHGFVNDKPFEVTNKEVTSTEACLTIRYQNKGDVVGYPFPFDFTVTYSLRKTAGPTTMHLTYEALNTGSRTCPVAFGWHPYFTFNGQSVDTLTITMADRAPIVLDQKTMIPTGREEFREKGPLSLENVQLDNAYELKPNEEGFAETSLRSDAADASIVIRQQTGPGKLNYLVCYTPPRRESVAIEALTANVDAFNNGEGLVALAPGHTFCGDISVRLD